MPCARIGSEHTDLIERVVGLERQHDRAGDVPVGRGALDDRRLPAAQGDATRQHQPRHASARDQHTHTRPLRPLCSKATLAP